MHRTMSLRFVEREEDSNLAEDGSLLPHGVVRVIKRRVLQQLWVSAYVGELSQWHDVPLEDETPNVEFSGGAPLFGAASAGTQG